MSTIPEPDQTPEGPAFEGRLLPRPEDEVVDQGPAFDIATVVTRRRVLALAGVGVGALTLAACGGSGSTASDTTDSSSSSSSGSSSSSSTGTTSTVADGEIPEETNGPFPADGTNGVNVLEESGIVRSDITSSIDGDYTVEGVPLEFSFNVTDMLNDDAPFEGVAVYVWHCDAQGQYSMYSEGVTDETFLRGIQVADSDGTVTFQTIVPGCYTGRWPHIHFEVYPDADSATTGENAIATSQVAFPTDVLDAVYALDTYSGSTANLEALGGIENDNVFGDGYELEMGTFSGDTSGYVGSLAVAIDTSTEASGASGGAEPSGGGGPGGDGGPGGGGQPPAGDPPTDMPTGMPTS
ncbi:MAG: 3,4-dioxygenase subunit beta [Nocardioides sp.]|nr:3,4-dioxygenase subunit beta [Nocardioides sp.]